MNTLAGKNIIPIAFSVFAIIFVGYVLVGAIEHYLIKYISR
jgi:hypothetical protein